MSEKRKSTRFIINEAIEFDLKREHFFRAEGINISEGGLLCLTSETITPLSRVEISFTIPFGKNKEIQISTEGIVMHVGKQGNKSKVGISFVDMDEDDKKILKKFIKTLS